MRRRLIGLFLILVALCILIGFFVEHEHATFWWHEVPSVDAVFGALGAVLLVVATRVLASFAQREEDFYD